jgi:hypothetical protein
MDNFKIPETGVSVYCVIRSACCVQCNGQFILCVHNGFCNDKLFFKKFLPDINSIVILSFRMRDYTYTAVPPYLMVTFPRPTAVA